MPTKKKITKKTTVKKKVRKKTKPRKNLIGVDPLAWINDDQKTDDTGVVMNSEPEIDRQMNEHERSDDVLQNTNIFEISSSICIVDVNGLYERFTTSIVSFDDTIEVDVSQIEMIDTAGLQLLTMFQKVASDKNKNIEWKRPSEYLIRSAGLLGLTETLGF